MGTRRIREHLERMGIIILEGSGESRFRSIVMKRWNSKMPSEFEPPNTFELSHTYRLMHDRARASGLSDNEARLYVLMIATDTAFGFSLSANALLRRLIERLDDFMWQARCYFKARARFKNSRDPQLRELANIPPDAGDALDRILHAVHTIGDENFDMDGNYVSATDANVQPREQQNLVAQHKNFKAYKIDDESQLNDPYFCRGTTYCVTTRNYFGEYGGPPYYVLVKDDGTTVHKVACIVPNALKAGDLTDVFRNAKNTDSLTPQEAKVLAPLIRKIIPIKVFRKNVYHVKQKRMRQNIDSEELAKLLRVLVAVYGKPAVKSLNLHRGSLVTPPRMKPLSRYQRAREHREYMRQNPDHLQHGYNY